MAGDGKFSLSEEQKHAFKAMPMGDLLTDLGFKVALPYGRTHGVICSPLRPDNNPSFGITYDSNNDIYRYHDFATGEKGTNYDIIKEVFNLVSDESVWNKIGELYYSGQMIQANIVKERGERARANNSGSSEDSEVKIHAVNSRFSFNLLIDYAQRRGISPEVLNKYCQEVRITSGMMQKPITAISIKNSAGGRVIRWESSSEREKRLNPDAFASEGKRVSPGKRTTKAAPTYITADGRNVESFGQDRSDAVLVFEGFFDFLAYIQWNWEMSGREASKFLPGYDVVILNSVTNREHAIESIINHDNVFCFLDNDNDGDKCTNYIFKECMNAGVNCSDCMATYSVMKVRPDGTEMETNLSAEEYYCLDVSEAASYRLKLIDDYYSKYADYADAWLAEYQKQKGIPVTVKAIERERCRERFRQAEKKTETVEHVQKSAGMRK